MPTKKVSSLTAVLARKPDPRDGSILVSPAEAERIFAENSIDNPAQHLRTGTPSKHLEHHLARLKERMGSHWVPALSRIVVALLPDRSQHILDGNHTLLALSQYHEAVRLCFAVSRFSSLAEATDAFVEIGAVYRRRTFQFRAMAAGVPVPRVGSHSGSGGRAPSAVNAAFQHYGRYGTREVVRGLQGWKQIAPIYTPALERLSTLFVGEGSLRKSPYSRALLSTRSLSVLLELERLPRWSEFRDALIAGPGNPSSTIGRALHGYIEAEYAQTRRRPNVSQTPERLVHCWNALLEGRFRVFKTRANGWPISGSKLVYHNKATLAQWRAEQREVA